MGAIRTSARACQSDRAPYTRIECLGELGGHEHLRLLGRERERDLEVGIESLVARRRNEALGVEQLQLDLGLVELEYANLPVRS